jgi:tetratricopeptide (TPR) repeat protein
MLSYCARRLAMLLLVGVFCQQGSARAGDLDDCRGFVLEKAEQACGAIINDASRPVDDRVIAYANRSRVYFNRAKPDLALADAEAAVQLNPRSVPALLARASARQRMGSFDLALADLNQAIEIDPANPAVFTSRGILKNDQKAWTAAQADFNQAIALRPDFAPAYVGRARSYIETADLDKAMADLNMAISINPSVQNAFFWRGQVYRRKGDVDKAIEDFTRSIAQAPQADLGSYYARGQLFSAKGDYARAIADYNRFLAIKPDNQEVQRQRDLAVGMQTELAKIRGTPPPAQATPQTLPPAAMAGTMPALVPPAFVSSQLVGQAQQLFNQRKFAEALTPLNQALAGDPHNEPALRLRAASLLGLRRLAEARLDLNELVRLKPNEAPLLALRGMTAIGLNQPDQAVADVNLAITLDPNNALAYLGRGVIKRGSGKLQDAVADFDRSIAINPKEGPAFSERGQAYMGLGQIDKSLVDFDQAIALNPLDDSARAARGLSLLMKGNSAEGLVDIKNVLDRNPNNQVAQIGQGLAMLVSGQFDRSIVALNQLVGKAVALDSIARLLRARAYLGRKDTDSAMADLDAVLGKQPDNADALLLRGITWSEKHDYAKSLDDLSGAIAHRETVEGYFARAKTYEAQNNPAKAAKDYQRATELAPKSVFDVLAQAESKQKVKLLSKQLPCGSATRVAADAACL